MKRFHNGDTPPMKIPGDKTSPKKRTRPSGRSVTIDDVARLAGVSTGSVSRALNEPSKVSERLRTAVLKAAAKLNWVPHGAGKALASRRTRTIGAIIPTLANPNFATAMNAVQQRLMEGGYILLVGCSEYDPEQAFIQSHKMIERGVDGLILVGENYPNRLWELLARQAIPYVITYGFRRGGEHPSVGFDNYRAFVRLTRYVLNLGHSRIGMIAQRALNNDRALARLQGALDTLHAKGIEMPAEHLTEKEWTVAGGREGLREIARVAPRPTAVICANDALAVGAILECHALGLDVPKDISIVGCDDAEIAAHLSPALTTLRVPTAEIGRLTADYLLAKVGGAPPPASLELDVELIVRDSAAPPHSTG
jgi:LacI family transcriptional regulator